LQLHSHKYILWYLVFGVNTESGRRREAKAGVILWVSQYNNCSKAQLLALLKTCSNKCRADTFPLVLRRYSHGSQPHHLEVRIPRQRNRRKHNVTDNLTVVLSDERNNRLSLF
jgi:hypothetical protein